MALAQERPVVRIENVLDACLTSLQGTVKLKKFGCTSMLESLLLVKYSSRRFGACSVERGAVLRRWFIERSSFSSEPNALRSGSYTTVQAFVMMQLSSDRQAWLLQVRPNLRHIVVVQN